MDDTIKRSEAIKAINKALDRETLLYGLVRKIAVDAIRSTPSADRPQGEVDVVEIYESAERRLERGEITLGDFEKIIEPLRYVLYDRPQGKWIKDNLGTVICSECKRPRRDSRVNHINFCNSCGARMRGVSDETTSD